MCRSSRPRSATALPPSAITRRPPWRRGTSSSDFCKRRGDTLRATRRVSSDRRPVERSRAMADVTSRRYFLATTSAAVGGVVLAQAPAALGQQTRELHVWHTEVEPQTVKTIQDTSIAEFEKKFPGF